MATLIFDFDGTIADTLDAIVLIANRLAVTFGYSVTTPEKLRYYRSLSLPALLAEAEIPLFKVPFLIRRVRQEMRQEIHRLQPVADLSDVLKTLAANHQMIIVSSNATRNIQQFLQQNGLDAVFQAIYANVGLQGKPRILQRILNRYGLKASQALYIGDETRDIVAAKQLNMSVVAVSWGFSDRKALQAQAPTFLIDSPQQLLAIAAAYQPVHNA